MAVNLLEEDRLVYHDNKSNTLDIRPHPEGLSLNSIEAFGSQVESARVIMNRGAVETLRDSLTNWLGTGRLK